MNEAGERAREEAWALVAVMVGVGAIGAVLGYLLDVRLGTQPWFLLFGSVAGLALGLFLTIRSGLAFARRENRSR